MTRVLIIEDEPTLLVVLQAALEFGGFESQAAPSGREGLERFRTGGFDAVLLDLGLPDMDGRELIHVLRAESDIPLLVVSGRGGEQDRIDALDSGADDFVPKPFLPGELLARLRAALRRHQGPARPRLEVDLVKRRVVVDGEEVRLSGNEGKLLFTLAERLDEAVPYGVIGDAVWGDYCKDGGNRLRVLVNGVRQKIETEPATPRHLLSERGVGYRLRAAATVVEGVSRAISN